MESIDLQRRLTELEARMVRMEDVEAIRTLKCEHALASDEPAHLRERLLAIVTEDIEFDYGTEFGRFSGKAKLAEPLEDTPFAWTFHCMIPKRIDVTPDGRTATGIWYLWEPAVAPDPASGEPRTLWLAGVYTDTYCKQADGRWLINRDRAGHSSHGALRHGLGQGPYHAAGASAWTTEPPPELHS